MVHASHSLNSYMGVSQKRGTLLGVSIIRIIVFWGRYCGPLVL